jgi:hypothetical protein
MAIAPNISFIRAFANWGSLQLEGIAFPPERPAGTWKEFSGALLGTGDDFVVEITAG